MVCSLYIVVLLLWILQCGAGILGVQQEPLIQTAFANEQINASCNVIFPYKKEYLDFVISYFRINSKGKETLVNSTKISETICSKCENKTATKNYTLYIKPINHTSVTATYYCKADWKNANIDVQKGAGTFILFRDIGYREPSIAMWICLIVIIIILAVLSIMGTVFLFWKRKVVCPERSQVKKCPDQGPQPKHPSGNLEPPESTYMDLEAHQSDVYFVIENEGNPSHTKILAAQMSQQGTQGEIYDNVYENF
ncbi:NFAT activation molecule 1 isoform X2 [Hemicordylus capensis]|uniref:NFAT activation molecule 1 isoform X2 n=1 Tax=Hemicordylus capensis TaxID=884348 RepID=UPI0023026EE8|nr:NFAT activation molecule 1 isoform X2 [Hemicordylus capensis]